MAEDIRKLAEAELSSIEDRFLSQPMIFGIASKDKRRWTICFKDGKQRGYLAYWNKRRKAIRDWLRKWGPSLKTAGYRVVPARQTDLIKVKESEDEDTSNLSPAERYHKTRLLEDQAQYWKEVNKVLRRSVPVYFVEEIPTPPGDDDVAAQLAEEISKKSPNSKTIRVNKLRKHEEEE